jgi:hypothetical protein
MLCSFDPLISKACGTRPYAGVCANGLVSLRKCSSSLPKPRRKPDARSIAPVLAQALPFLFLSLRSKSGSPV